MMGWRNQVAVVTGSARGLGQATAQLLAQRGAAVCVNYAVHADAAQALVAEIATATDGLSRWRQTSPTRLRSRRWSLAPRSGDYPREQRRSGLAGYARHLRPQASRA